MPGGQGLVSYTVAGLTNSTSYTFEVRLVSSVGNGAASPQASATPRGTVPPAPTLTAEPGNNQVKLTWTSGGDGGETIDRWEYRYSTDGTLDAEPWTAIPSSGPTTTTHTVTGLTSGTTYFFQVRAHNARGNGTPSTIVSGATPEIPPAPTLTAVPGNGQVKLTWTSGGDGGAAIDRWEYRYSTDGTLDTEAWTAIPSSGPATTTHTVTGLTNGTAHLFQVRAHNSVGNGAASPRANAMPVETVPPAPTLTAKPGNNQVTLTWVSGGDGGETIDRWESRVTTDGTLDSETWTPIPGSGPSTTTHTVTGLTNGTAHLFQVRAHNSVGNGAASRQASAMPVATVPPAPTLTAEPGNNQVTLTWVSGGDGGAAITEWQYRQTTGHTRPKDQIAWEGWTPIPGSGTATTSHTVTKLADDTPLMNGTTYFFQVRAHNSLGAGDASPTVYATPGAPPAPRRLTATPGNGQVRLTWTSGGDNGSGIYHWEYSQTTDNALGYELWTTVTSLEQVDVNIFSFTVTGLPNGTKHLFQVRAVNFRGNGAPSAVVSATPGAGGGGGGGGGGGPSQTSPDAPTNLLADAGDEAVTLAWDAPEDDGGAAITDYQYRINGEGEWTAIGSTDTTHTVTGLVNGTAYVFEVRAVNRNGRGRASNRAEATPEAPEVFTLDFAHFANGTGITSDFVFLNVSPHLTQPALYFYDQGGDLIDPESVVDVTVDMEVTEDGALTVRTAMEPLGQLAISTHGQGELVSGSVKVLSDGPIGGGVRYGVPGVGVAGVGASPPVRDVVFPARRQAGGIRTAAALHNLEEEAVGVNCRLMSGGVVLEEVQIPLEANGQASWFIEEAFPTTDTSDFLGSVHCTAPGRGRFTAIAVETDAARRIFNTLSVVPVNRGRAEATTLDFAHFANGTWITDLVFVNLETQPSGPPLSPFHQAILPSRPAIYFYDTEGNLIDPALLVDLTGDLAITEDGALTVQTEMEPLGVLTISTHGRGALVTGSVQVVSEGPIGGMLRFEHPALGVAGAAASPPLSDAIFPVRRQEGGITTGVALHNLESSPGLLRCDLMREGVLLDAASIPLEANGQTSWLIDQAFPATDTSDFAGSVRCDAVGEDRFTAVALEMDPGNRIFTTLPVVPLPEMPSQE